MSEFVTPNAVCLRLGPRLMYFFNTIFPPLFIVSFDHFFLDTLHLVIMRVSDSFGIRVVVVDPVVLVVEGPLVVDWLDDFSNFPAIRRQVLVAGDRIVFFKPPLDLLMGQRLSDAICSVDAVQHHLVRIKGNVRLHVRTSFCLHVGVGFTTFFQTVWTHLKNSSFDDATFVEINLRPGCVFRRPFLMQVPAL